MWKEIIIQHAHHRNGVSAAPTIVLTVRTRASAVPLTEPVAVHPATKDEPVTRSVSPEPGVVIAARTVHVPRPTSSVTPLPENAVVRLGGKEICVTRSARTDTLDLTVF